MDTSAAHCPQCQAERTTEADECIRCGVIFAKYRPLASRLKQKPPAPSLSRSRWFQTAKEWLIELDRTADSMTFYGRVALFMGLLWWGWKFITTPLETNYTGESVLHLLPSG